MRRLNAVMVLLIAVILTGMTCGAYATIWNHIDNNGTHSIEGIPTDYAIFEDNSKDASGNPYTRGGAINNREKGIITKIIYAEFINNQAKYGGAISNNDIGTLGTISNTVFSRNTGTSNGGAIYSGGFFTRIENSLFESNAAWGDSNSGAGYGGAIYADLNEYDLTIINTNFTGNYAYRKGGAIAVFRRNLNIVAKNSGSSTFTANTQGGEGNDIYMGSTNQILNISAYGEDSYVRLDGGIDFNKGLTVNINNKTSESETVGNGTVYINGDSGSASKRANFNLYGGNLSFSAPDNVKINDVYAGKVTLYGNTKLAFDINLDDNVTDGEYDVFSISSITGTNSAKLIFDADSFNILSHFSDDSESKTMTLITSSNLKSYVQFMDGDKKVNVIYKYYDDYESGEIPRYKIRLTTDGKFIISVPKYIDPVANPLAYAVNFDVNDTQYYNDQDNANATIEKTGSNEVSLTLKKDIILDSWEDLPDEHKELKERNIIIPNKLIIQSQKTKNNKNITAEDNLDGIYIPESKGLECYDITFKEFNKAIQNHGGNILLTRVSFQNNTNTDGQGSAIYNKDGIIRLESVKNKSLFYSNSSQNGGAIYNEGIMSIDYSNFGANGNPKKKISYANIASENGGAIYNAQSDIDTGTTDQDGNPIYASNLVITNSNFIENTAQNGGAIYNRYADSENPAKESVSVGGIFTRNIAEKEGGAIYNEGNLSTLNSTFGKSGKSAEANKAINGGAVANANGGFFASENTSYYNNIADNYGGAVYNAAGGVAKIQGGTFSQNQADFGGAIYNSANPDDETVTRLILDSYTDPNNQKLIATKFTKNISNSGYGGAIYNLGTIAPFDSSIIEDNLPVAGDFTSNKATLENQMYDKRDKEEMYTLGNSPYGGAIYNGVVKDESGVVLSEATLELNQANFSSNSASANVTVNTKGYEDKKDTTYGTTKVTRQTGKGGAIYSNSSNNLYISTSQFSKNTAAEAGGGICSENENATLSIVNSEFTSNTIKSTITTVRTISREQGKNVNRKVTIKESTGSGGAIYALGKVEINNENSKYGKYIKDSKDATKFTSNSSARGGAIYAQKGIDIYNATFSKNSATYTCTCNDKNKKEETTQKALAEGYGAGGAVYTEGDVNINATHYTEEVDGMMSVEPLPQTVVFTSNSATNGGAIYTNGKVFVKDAEFTSNKASNGYGGAIYAKDGIQIVNTDFNKNSAAYGGAIYVAPDTKAFLINSSFTNNTASKAGGAIYMDEGSTVYISAYSKDVNISGNKAAGKGNSVFLANNSNLYIYAHADDERRYVVSLSDGITGIAGEDTHVYQLGNGELKITGPITNVSYNDPAPAGSAEYIAKMSKDIILGDSYVDPNGSRSLSSTNSTRTFSIGNENLVSNTSFNLSGNTNLNIANSTLGKLSLKKLSLANNTTTNMAIDVSLKNGTSDKVTAESVEGTGTLNVSTVNLINDSKSPVTVNIGEDSLITEMSATKAETAQATYRLRAGVDENGYLTATAYGQQAKPCTLAAPVAAQLGGYLTQINSYDQAFMNMDMNMLKTREERQAEGVVNRYAYNGNDYTFTSDNGINKNGKGLWARPYATFERVNLTHGPKVGNIAYGSFFGGDADLKYFGNGWARQFSAYVGYNGSTQDFDRQSVDQNGGTIGVAEVWYKNNFFTGLTVNVGANAVNASTDLGHENFPMLMAGVASKTGYNFEMAKGKFIIQPSILLSYSFVHTFSHKNGLGNRVSSSPLHAVQVAPGLKFIFNLPKGWQPYLGVNMRWNIIDKTHFGVQDVTIPDMSIRPYIEYGVGVQKRWGERFVGHVQALVRNGGRNGVMLSVGLKWFIGRNTPSR